MRTFAKLIHKSHITFLRTCNPVHFYGMPDNKVYLFYARTFHGESNKMDIEFVFATHSDFSYDYSIGELVPKKFFNAPVYNEMVDNPDPNIEVLEVSREIKSYTQALLHLNEYIINNFPILNKSISGVTSGA